MASRVVLHIGQQKSGTTYLQEVLQGCTDRLAQAGVLYPLPTAERRRRTIESHDWATQGLLGTEYPWVSQRQASRERGTWEWLAREVRRWHGTALVSAEGLSVIRTAAIHRVLDGLGADDVDVVVTARSLGRSVPSLWQQNARNGRCASFETYLEKLAEQRERSVDDVEAVRELHLWRSFALGRLVRRWAAVVGPERVRLVVSPSSPPTMLWSRFASAVGLAELADGLPAELIDKRTHAGLTAPEAVALLSVNSALAQTRLSRAAANRVRRLVITHGFAVRADRGPRIAIPPPWRDQVAKWSREDLAEFAECAEAGVASIGDVADLRYEPSDDSTPAPSPEEISDANAAAMLVLLHPRVTDAANGEQREAGTRVERVLRRHVRRFARLPG